MVKNITGVSEGSFRSLNGAADENIFIGKACKAGFYCFFKAWRDMPYDAVLEYDGILYRVEVKGSSGNTFALTRGGRAGQQINREAENRERRIERSDCDFVVCVDSNEGDCYIVPVDFLDICDRNSYSVTMLEAYKEKWKLFMHGNGRLPAAYTRDGLMGLEVEELRNLAQEHNVVIPDEDIVIHGARGISITEEKEKLVYCIWNKMASD